MTQARSFFLRPLILAGSLYAYAIATTLYLNAAFLETLVPRETVGLLFALSAILALICLTLVPRILNRISVRSLTLVSTTLALASLVGMMTQGPLWVMLASFVVYFASNTITMYAVDVLIEAVAPTEKTGRIRGAYLALCGVSYMIAPAIAGFLVDRLGFGALYGWTAAIVTLVLVILIARAPVFPYHARDHAPGSTTRNTWISFFRNTSLRHVYLANFILQFFYTWMVVYTPLLLHDTLGVAWNDIGLIFTVMLSAFVLLDVPLGYLSDKLIGEKRLMTIGFVILGAATIGFAYVAVPGTPLWVVALVLFATRIGAATVEVTTESAFFKSVQSDDSDRIGIFRNTYPLAYLIGPAIASAIISIFSIKVLFGILGFICFVGIWHALHLKSTK
jgi:MFS family permease